MFTRMGSLPSASRPSYTSSLTLSAPGAAERAMSQTLVTPWASMRWK